MDYEFKSEVKIFDYWLLTMYNTYHSMVGVVNIVFFLSMIALNYRFYSSAGALLQALMFLGLILIPVVHPFGVFLKAKSQMLLTPKEGVNMQFGITGVRVKVGEKEETIRWNKIRGVADRCGMLIIYSDSSHGYILTKRVIKEKKAEFLDYLRKKIKESR